jgi:LmbE family N-acetylglucosaminyl deacetylase
MQTITTAQDVRKLGTILSVWAHPDDETFCCAGVMAAAVANGQQVVCVTATKGDAGVQDESRWPAARLGDIRASELAAALKILGIKHHYWLPYRDGHCAEVEQAEAVQRLRSIIERYQPQTILTFGPDGLTGHPDHCAVSAWVARATAGTPTAVYHIVQEERTYEESLKAADEQFDMYFNIDKPPLVACVASDICFHPTPDLQAKKLAALKAMPSQTEALLAKASPKTIQAFLTHESFVKKV